MPKVQCPKLEVQTFAVVRSSDIDIKGAAARATHNTKTLDLRPGTLDLWWTLDLSLDKFLQHLVGMPDGPRMLYRTRHIYILLSGLLNLVIGTYFTYGWTRWRRSFQFLGSALIVTATVLFLAGFFWEAQMSGLVTPWTGRGIYLLAYGTLFHSFSGLGKKKLL